MGCAPAFQAVETGSSPVPRSNIQDDPVIEDEVSLIEPIDHTIMARMYEYQAMAADPYLTQDYRDHYLKRLVKIRDELNIMLREIGYAD
jgi:hypothetical protein